MDTEAGGDPISKLADDARSAFTPDAGSGKANIFKSMGHAIGEKAGAAGRAAGGVLGGAKDMAGHLPGEGAKTAAGLVGKGAELTKSGGEALINRMGHVLEDRKAFGKSIADFALHSAVSRGLSMSSRELAKSVLVVSGAAGALGGGLTGTVVIGAFVGAMSGALVEYARQVNKNLDREAAADPSIAGRRAECLLKFKELRHARVLKPTDLKRIRNGAIIGMIAGTGAGALAEHTELLELIKKVPGAEGIGNIAGKIGGVVGEMSGGIGSTMGNAATGIGEAVKGNSLVGGAGELAGGTGQTIGGLTGEAGEMAGNIPGVHGAGDIAAGISHTTGELAGGVGSTVGDTAGNLGHTLSETAGGASQTGGNLLGGAGEMARNIPGVSGIGDIAGGAGRTAGDLLGGVGNITDQVPGVTGAKEMIGHTLGLGGVHEAGQQAAQGVSQAAQETIPTPDGFVPQSAFNDVHQQLNDAHQTIGDLEHQLAEAKQALAGTGAVAGAAVATHEAATGLDSISSTMIHDHVVSGSVLDHSLTYDGNPWVLLENGTKNIGHVFEAAGETSPINQQALAANLQQATNLWVHEKLNPSTNPDLYTLFHLSNGTSSVYKDLLNKDTLLSLKNLGIVSK